MKLHRIDLDTEAGPVELTFHPEVTVVTGLGDLEQEALASEIMAALGPGRAGLSAEITTRDGRRLTFRRPLSGPVTVHDADPSSTPVTTDGPVDILDMFGCARSLRLTGVELAAATAITDRVRRLAELDQDQLWSMAIGLAELEVGAARAAEEEARRDAADQSVADEIEEAHAAYELAADQLDRANDQGRLGVLCLGIVTVAVWFITHPLVAIPFAAALAALVWWIKTTREAFDAARDEEEQVLAAHGLGAYLDFQMRKVDDFTTNAGKRRESIVLAEQRRQVEREWEALVGHDVSLEWAANHRPTIAAAAARLRSSGDSIFTETQTDVDDGIAVAIADRIDQITTAAEGAPLILDDVFGGLDDEATDRVLWLIDHHCRQVQFIVMSSDERVRAWAGRRARHRHAEVMVLAAAETADVTIDAPAAAAVATAPTSAQIELV